MATLSFTGAASSASRVTFTPIASALSNLPNGAGTLAALIVRLGPPAGLDEVCGLVNSAVSAWYHTIICQTSGTDYLEDDDGLVGPHGTTAVPSSALSGDNYLIAGVDWPSGGAALERIHISSTIGGAESWTHENTTANNGGNRAGPGTSGLFCIGEFGEGGPMNGWIALIAVWAGIRFTDTDWTNLWINKKTSDWWNHPAGHPTMLIECTSLTLTDIGANPSTYSATGASVGLAGTNPTGWTFDGQGVQGAGDNPPIGLLGRGAGW